MPEFLIGQKAENSETEDESGVENEEIRKSFHELHYYSDNSSQLNRDHGQHVEDSHQLEGNH